MSRNERTADRRRRRSALGVGTGAGAAFAAALISMGTAPAASAVVGDADLDGFQDLFGTGGINTWTAGADQGLAAVSPALASQLDTAVDAFRAVDQDPISNLAFAFDPTAFTGNPDLGGLPVTSMGDLAVGTDYLLSFSGLGATLDPIIDNLLGMPMPL